jgi:uncharacterized protein
MFQTVVGLATGLVAGMLSGLIGLGGGIIILPVLIYILKMNQRLAQGTALAILLPPIGILAVWNYYKNGYVDVKISALICAGFIAGAFFGSKWAMLIHPRYLKIGCGVIFVLLGLKMVFSKD